MSFVVDKFEESLLEGTVGKGLFELVEGYSSTAFSELERDEKGG